MKKRREFSNFGFSTILLTFSMICIVTFSALAFVTANSDYKLSKRVADNNSSYYRACEKVWDEISQIDAILASAYDGSPDKAAYYEAIKTALSDNDTAINKNLSENESNGKVTGLTYTITCTVSDTQTLTVKLDINYPVHRQDAFYKIKQWKLNTDTAFEENDTLNLIGGNFADKYKNQPTLAFTHFQPAQPTTVGKRATLWLNEFMLDLEDLEYVQGTLKLLGSKGTTGTQASFLELFDGDNETIDKIDPMIAKKMGFKDCYPVSGQTYSRKVDTRVVNVLAGIAASATKMSNDIRLLQHLKEVEEPFEKNQIGSSAMAYKRNPMRSERIASLSRYVLADVMNPAITSATQWFERTLDDSANKRLSIPEGFLAIDGILDLCLNVVDGLVVYPKVIEKHFMAEIPFMATENIMMDAVKNGGNRQELHEKIRQLSMQAGKTVKEEGKENNLVDLIAADPAFGLTKADIEKNLKPELYVGRAPRQVEVYLRDVVNPVLEAHKDESGVKAEINV